MIYIYESEDEFGEYFRNSIEEFREKEEESSKSKARLVNI